MAKANGSILTVGRCHSLPAGSPVIPHKTGLFPIGRRRALALSLRYMTINRMSQVWDKAPLRRCNMRSLEVAVYERTGAIPVSSFGYFDGSCPPDRAKMVRSPPELIRHNPKDKHHPRCIFIKKGDTCNERIINDPEKRETEQSICGRQSGTWGS